MRAPVTQKIEIERLSKVLHESLQSQKRLCGYFGGNGMYLMAQKIHNI